MTKEELEKEAEEKYSEVDREFIDCQDEGEVFNIGYILGAEPREKRIEELEKENAELKRDKEDLIFIRNQNAKCMCEDKERLTKAKKILKKVVTDFHNMDCVTVHIDKTIAEAEQFLKDSEVEK